MAIDQASTIISQHYRHTNDCHAQIPRPLHHYPPSSVVTVAIESYYSPNAHCYILYGQRQRMTPAIVTTSAKCKSVWKPYANLPDTLVALTSTSKYFQMLPAPPGALQCVLRLYKSILRCFCKHLQLWRCIQDTTRFDG